MHKTLQIAGYTWIYYLSTGAGFLPPTVCHWQKDAISDYLSLKLNIKFTPGKSIAGRWWFIATFGTGAPSNQTNPKVFKRSKLKKTKDYPLVNQHSNGKPPLSIGDTSSNGGFPIAMLVYRTVLTQKTSCPPIFAGFLLNCVFSVLDIKAYRTWGSRVNEAQVPGRFASTFLVGFWCIGFDLIWDWFQE